MGADKKQLQQWTVKAYEALGSGSHREPKSFKNGWHHGMCILWEKSSHDHPTLYYKEHPRRFRFQVDADLEVVNCSPTMDSHFVVVTQGKWKGADVMRIHLFSTFDEAVAYIATMTD